MGVRGGLWRPSELHVLFFYEQWESSNNNSSHFLSEYYVPGTVLSTFYD